MANPQHIHRCTSKNKSSYFLQQTSHRDVTTQGCNTCQRDRKRMTLSTAETSSAQGCLESAASIWTIALFQQHQGGKHAGQDNLNSVWHQFYPENRGIPLRFHIRALIYSTLLLQGGKILHTGHRPSLFFRLVSVLAQPRLILCNEMGLSFGRCLQKLSVPSAFSTVKRDLDSRVSDIPEITHPALN